MAQRAFAHLCALCGCGVGVHGSAVDSDACASTTSGSTERKSGGGESLFADATVRAKFMPGNANNVELLEKLELDLWEKVQGDVHLRQNVAALLKQLGSTNATDGQSCNDGASLGETFTPDNVLTALRVEGLQMLCDRLGFTRNATPNATATPNAAATSAATSNAAFKAANLGTTTVVVNSGKALVPSGNPAMPSALDCAAWAASRACLAPGAAAPVARVGVDAGVGVGVGPAATPVVRTGVGATTISRPVVVGGSVGAAGLGVCGTALGTVPAAVPNNAPVKAETPLVWYSPLVMAPPPCQSTAVLSNTVVANQPVHTLVMAGVGGSGLGGGGVGGCGTTAAAAPLPVHALRPVVSVPTPGAAPSTAQVSETARCQERATVQQFVQEAVRCGNVGAILDELLTARRNWADALTTYELKMKECLAELERTRALLRDANAARAADAASSAASVAMLQTACAQASFRLDLLCGRNLHMITPQQFGEVQAQLVATSHAIVAEQTRRTMCVLCMARPAVMMFLPCRHALVCATCCPSLKFDDPYQRPRCMTCYQPVECAIPPLQPLAPTAASTLPSSSTLAPLQAAAPTPLQPLATTAGSTPST